MFCKTCNWAVTFVSCYIFTLKFVYLPESMQWPERGGERQKATSNVAGLYCSPLSSISPSCWDSGHVCPVYFKPPGVGFELQSVLLDPAPLTARL